MRRAISGSQVISKTMDRKKSLILGEYLAAGETMMLYAPPGQGKTINALILGIALSTGTSFYDWKAKEPMPVLFVEGGELTATGIAGRMQAIYTRQGVKEDDNFHLMAPTKAEPFTYKITDPEHQKRLMEYIDHFGIKCVIFDNYNSLRDGEENEFVAWQRLERMLNKLKTKRVASVIIHHTNKEGQRQSGAQRKEDFCDMVLRIQHSTLSTKDVHYIETAMEKFRWGEAMDTQLTELVFKEDELDLIPACYEEVLARSIRRDLLLYNKPYVKEKYKFLGYKLHHYTQEVEELCQ